MPYAADTQIAGLDAAAALTGAEIAALSQGGATVRETLANIRTFYEKRAVAGAKALALLAGEEGCAFDFFARSAAIRDFAQAKNYLGRPEDLLTVSRASTAAYIDRDRVLKYAGTGVLRYDHDPSSGAPLGALIEGSRTNSLTRSEEADNAAWTKAKTTVTANAVAAPDGATTADTLVEDNTSGEHYIDQNFAATNAVVYTWSTWVKAAAGTRSLRLRTATAVAAFVDFNPSTGVLGTPSGGTATATAYANGWYRVALTVTAGSTTTLVCRRQVVNAGSTSYLGDLTQAFYLWGAQLEVGAFASSYIPTTSGTVTRSADDVSMAYALLPASVGGNEATLFADVDFPNYAAAIGKSLITLQVSSSERLRLNINSSAVLDGEVISASADTLTGSAPTIATRLTKAAMAARANEAAVSANGSGGTTVDTAVTMPVGTYDTLKIGAGSSGGEPYGTIRKIAYYPRRMTAAEIDALTA